MLIRVCAFLLLAAAFTGFAHAADDEFKAGTHYYVVEPPQPSSTAGKVEVVEVFSYACPACNAFQATMKKLKAALPANAELVYLPAAFRPDEDWPVFQRGFYAAQALGILDKTHDATFDAIWKDEGTLRISDPTTRQRVKTMPTIDDVGAFYAKTADIKAEDFTGVASSFAVNTKMKRADAQIKAYGVDSTPTLIVAGKYRMTVTSAGGPDKIVPLVKFLVDKEAAAK
jgi:thiol:disulfide interchange protein DsbA